MNSPNAGRQTGRPNAEPHRADDRRRITIAVIAQEAGKSFRFS